MIREIDDGLKPLGHVPPTVTETLKLPDGSVVTPDDVFLYNGYPYRFVPGPDDAAPAFLLSPLYWGGGDMDVPFEDRAALVDQWEPAESGQLDDDGWREWLDDAHENDQFDDAELDALASEIRGGSGDGRGRSNADGTDGILGRVRRFLTS